MFNLDNDVHFKTMAAAAKIIAENRPGLAKRINPNVTPEQVMRIKEILSGIDAVTNLKLSAEGLSKMACYVGARIYANGFMKDLFAAAFKSRE